MPADALHLMILSCSCVCGNRWTHSYSILALADGSLGGTPTPQEEYHLAPIKITTSPRNYNHCYRCVSLHLKPETWNNMQADINARAPKQLEAALDYTPRSRPSSRLTAHKKKHLSLEQMEAGLLAESKPKDADPT